MKAKLLSLLSLSSLGFLASCTQPVTTPAAPALATPGAVAQGSNPYGVPGVPAVGSYTPPTTPAPYQPINPPAAAPYTPSAPAAYTPPSTYTPPAPAAGGQSHTIVKGESLWGISRKYGVTVDQLRQANSMTGDTIIEGRSLTIPAR